MKIHHIGYLVKNIQNAIQTMQQMDYDIEHDIIRDFEREVDICFLMNNGYRVELISPINKESILYSLLRKYKNSPYHICYECKNIYELDDEVIIRESVLIEQAKKAPAIDNKQVVFYMHPHIGMIEFVEKGKNEIS